MVILSIKEVKKESSLFFVKFGVLNLVYSLPILCLQLFFMPSSKFSRGLILNQLCCICHWMIVTDVSCSGITLQYVATCRRWGLLLQIPSTTCSCLSSINPSINKFPFLSIPYSCYILFLFFLCHSPVTLIGLLRWVVKSYSLFIRNFNSSPCNWDIK